MGKVYQSGKKTFSARARVLGYDCFVSGCSSRAEAKEELERRVREIRLMGKPHHMGPQRTTVAQALQDFGLEHLPNLKGAPQEARRVNKYLKACGLQLLEVLPRPNSAPDGANDEDLARQMASGEARVGMHACVRLLPRQAVASIPPGLGPHRKKLFSKTSDSDDHRARLAATLVADVTVMDVQNFMTALSRDGLAPASVALERALLRGFFNFARKTWRWTTPTVNPATELKLPKVKNERRRVMSEEEQALLDEAIQDCRNSLVGPVVGLLTETAMRASEPLEHAKWGDVDWEGRILNLRDGKAGGREVPLTPKALEILRSLGPGPADQPIVQITYEALKAGWRRACERAGLKDLNLHDLRRTAATRMALKTGSFYMVKSLTGHEEDRMVGRYVNVTARDVVKVMHGEQPRSLMAGTAQRAVPSAGADSQGSAVPTPQGAAAAAPGTLQLTPAELQALVGAAVAQAVAALQGARQA